MEALFPGLDAAPNTHPLLVHFPIVLSLIALLMWAVGAVRRRDDLFQIGTWLLALSVGAAAATLVSGYLAADGLGHDAPGHERVHEHRDMMLVASSLLALVLGAAWSLRRRASQWLRWTLVAGLLAANVAVAVGADRGALLVYGYRVGTRATPPSSGEGPGHGHHHGGEDGGDHAVPRSGSDDDEHSHHEHSL